MTDLTTKAAEIRAGLEGVTPGPWFVSGARFKMNGGAWHSVNRYDESKKQDENVACVGFDPRDGVGLKDVHHIARLDPATVLAFLDERAEHLATIARLEGERDEAREAAAFADENRTFQIERAEKAEATAKDVRRLLKINDDPPKPGFHCACAYNQQSAEQTQECVSHADLRARAEKSEREWDAALKSARFWEEKHYAQMDAISTAIGSTRFMDPPDGGDVPLAEQVRRMREALTTAESTIAKQAERLKEMEGALKPFVFGGPMADILFGGMDDSEIMTTRTSLGDFRRARALTEGGAGHGE